MICKYKYIQGLTCRNVEESFSCVGDKISAGRQPWFKINGAHDYRHFLMVL